MLRAWFSANAATLRLTLPNEILGTLTRHLTFPLEPAQRAAWLQQIDHLNHLDLADAHIFLEFAIPRMGRRADAVVIAHGIVFVLEYKFGQDATLAAREQAHGYALDLKNFHASSHDKLIVPLLIASRALDTQLDLGFAAPDGVHPPISCRPEAVADILAHFARHHARPAFDPEHWAAGPYRPTPTIIEAAQALFQGHRVKEISRNEAGAENLTVTAEAIDAVIADAKTNNRKAIVFVTGVPGAGKTLAGLNIACRRMNAAADEDATYLSGNGPLVDVLREALKRDHRTRRHPGASRGLYTTFGHPRPHTAARSPDKFIQNVHHFRDEYARSAASPSEHVVIFDEAQRAWDRAMTGDFMRRKRGLPDFDLSEPAFLLSVMDRHPDWCVVVALIGDGQEINRGEAGVAGWTAALAEQFRHWHVHAPPRLLHGGADVPSAIDWQMRTLHPQPNPALHLAVSIRSFRSERVSAYVAALLGDDAATAAALLPASFPIVRTRSLAAARRWLRTQRRGGERAGLLASSNALRLKPEGLHVKASIDVPLWFLNPHDDIRASTALEDAATEFDVQGLELDWAGVAWDLNLRRGDDGWHPMRFRGTRWEKISDESARTHVLNSYRVLLTRARQGMVIVIPPGDAADPTRPPGAYDAIDAWLGKCGVPHLDAATPALARPEDLVIAT